MGAATVSNNRVSFFHSFEDTRKNANTTNTKATVETARLRIQRFCKTKAEVGDGMIVVLVMRIELTSVPAAATETLQYRGEGPNAKQSI